MQYQYWRNWKLEKSVKCWMKTALMTKREKTWLCFQRPRFPQTDPSNDQRRLGNWNAKAGGRSTLEWALAKREAAYVSTASIQSSPSRKGSDLSFLVFLHFHLKGHLLPNWCPNRCPNSPQTHQQHSLLRIRFLERSCILHLMALKHMTHDGSQRLPEWCLGQRLQKWLMKDSQRFQHHKCVFQNFPRFWYMTLE